MLKVPVPFNLHKSGKKMFLSLFFVVVLCLFLSGLFYLNTIETIVQISEKNISNTLENQCILIDTDIYSLYSTSQYLSSNIDGFPEIADPNISDIDRIHAIGDLASSFSQYTATNRLINSIMVYIPGINSIIDSSFSTIHADQYLSKGQIFENLDAAFFLSLPAEYSSGKILEDTLISSGRKTLLYVRKLQSKYGIEQIVVLFINPQTILNRLTLPDTTDSSALLMNTNGTILANSNLRLDSVDLATLHAPTQLKIGNEYYNVYKFQSKCADLAYVMAIPTPYVMENSTRLKIIYAATSLLTLLLGAGFSVIISVKNTKVFLKIKKTLENFSLLNTNDEDDLQYVEYSIQQLLNNNQTLKKDLEARKGLFTSNFLFRLVHGQYLSETDIDNSIAYCDIDLDYSYFTVVITKFIPPNKNDSELIQHEIYKSIIIRLWEQQFPNSLSTHSMFRDCLIFILCSNERAISFSEYEATFRKMIDEIYSVTSALTCIGIGPTVNKLTDIAVSYNSANIAIKYKGYQQQSRVVWFDALPKNVQGYYYPPDIQEKLYTLALLNDLDKIKSIIHNIFEQNFSISMLDSNQTTQLEYEMKNTMKKILHTLTHDENKKENLISIIDDINLNSNIEESYEQISHVYMLLCEITNDGRKKHDANIVYNIKLYIENNFQNPNLYISTIAAALELSEKYIPQVFKDLTGQTISNYIEEVRMNHVKQYLHDKDLNITDIATRIGYINQNTFYKAFKRRFGVSPKSYRETFFLHGESAQMQDE